MAGLGGLVLAFKADANVRIAKFTVLVKSVTNTSTQTARFAAVPSGANAAGIVGVTIEHFVEPNYFVKEGTDPSTVTGTTPTLYNLQGRPVQLQMNGYAKCYAAGAVNQGDELLVADAYGRVNNIANLGIASGTKVYVVGIAQNSTVNVNDVVEVLLSFYAKVV
jgi:hypothetical protein